jgi:hypothetical protein
MNSPIGMRKQELARGPRGRIVAADSITMVAAEDEGAVVVSGSHGGISSGAYALAVPLRLAVFNDAGIGKDDAGIAALAMLQAQGRAHGVVSRLNDAALALGLRVGDRLREALPALIDAGRC